MLKYILSKIFPNRYENKVLLDSYIKCHYGPFLKNNPYSAAESFYQTILIELTPFINHESTTLDVGCATGRLVF